MMTVTSWWHILCAVGAINLLFWARSALKIHRRQALLPADVYSARRWQLLLSGVYVMGCAYRSAFLVYDVPRICLSDSWLSSVIVGRSVATLAELCFVAQWALLLRESSRLTGSIVAKAASLALVPLIAVAEMCSWYSVLTTSNIGHVAEESIWGFSAALLVASVVTILPRTPRPRRPVLIGCCAVGLAYIAFMFLVDVPLYFSRWIEDEAHGRQYLSIAQGLLDISQRRVISYRWEDWKNEVAWMSLYFSVAVWISISLIHAPAFRAHAAADQPKRLRSMAGLRAS